MSRKVWLTAAAVGLVVIVGTVTTVMVTSHSRPGHSTSPPIDWAGLQVTGELELSHQTVENPTPVNGWTKFGDSCDATNGTMREVAEDRKQLLVRFTPRGDPRIYYDDCPAGTLFFISKTDFRDIQNQIEAARQADREQAAAEQRQKAHVRLLVAHVQMLLNGKKK